LPTTEQKAKIKLAADSRNHHRLTRLHVPFMLHSARMWLSRLHLLSPRRVGFLLLLCFIVAQIVFYVVSNGLDQENTRADLRSIEPGVSVYQSPRELLGRLMAKERAQSQFDGLAEQRFNEMVQVVQYPDDCSQVRALVVKFSKFENGLAAMLQWLIGAFTYAFVHGRTLVIANPDVWMWAPGCNQKSFECYFHSISKCSEADVWPSKKEVLLTERTAGERVVYMNPGQLDSSIIDYTLNEIRACRHWWPFAWCRYFYHVPEQFSDRGILWWKSQVAQYIFKPLPQITALVDEAKERLKWNETRREKVCVHIRRGDKIRTSIAEALEIVSMQRYADKITEICKRYGLGAAFIATDDPNIIDEVRSLVSSSIRILYDDKEKRNDGAGWKIRQGELKDEKVREEIEIATKNLVLLSECDYFVGTFTSWFSKFAYELKFSRASVHGVSMDVPLWYWQP